MVLTPALWLVTVAALFAVFCVLAFVAEQLEARDARRLRDECRARQRAEREQVAA